MKVTFVINCQVKAWQHFDIKNIKGNKLSCYLKKGKAFRLFNGILLMENVDLIAMTMIFHKSHVRYFTGYTIDTAVTIHLSL